MDKFLRKLKKLRAAAGEVNRCLPEMSHRVYETIGPQLTSIERQLAIHENYFELDDFNPTPVFPINVYELLSHTLVELHAGAGDWAAPWQDFKSTCEKYLPRIIPAGLTLLVRRWENRKGGDKLHNRYILTDVGGVEFGVGLDEGDPGTTDDITLLSADSYRRGLNDYTGSAPRLT
jgi:hypothetical protein